jgi:lysophospholipid acyltransferase (LPLAT)-like uncharacterized protein
VAEKTEAEIRLEKSPLKHRLLLFLLPLAAGLIRLVMLTMKIHLVDPQGAAPQAKPRPTIYAFWHQHQLLAMYFFRNFGIQVLVSRSRDGDYIAGALRQFGFGTVRSSTSSGKVAALRGLARELKSGRHAAITPDGPRGPLHEAQPGAVFLAAMTGCPLIPFGCAVDRAWRLRSWDRFVIPKPFSRAAIVYGDALPVPAKLDESALQNVVAEFNHRLLVLDAAAEEEVRRMRTP